MSYDWDVIVIGGGPAGLSAAVRARWIKQYKAVPCSTLLIENSYLGGLAGWHGCLFTGPSWRIDAKDILGGLTADLKKFNIPVHRNRVTRIDCDGEVKKVFTADGNVFRCLAIIIAAGIKVLVNEKDYLGRGLEITSMGYEFMVSRLKKLLSKRWEPRLVVVGSPKLKNLMPIIRELNVAGSSLVFVIEEHGEQSDTIVRGWVERLWGEGWVQGVDIRTSEEVKKIPCSGVLLDFNSYELHPVWRIAAKDRQDNFSFIPVDADMQTHVPGILAAGDVTAGGYNSFSRAVSQGITAGLSAYRYVFEKKFGTRPPLFAYRPTDFTLEPDFKELPDLSENSKPKALGKSEEIKAVLGDFWDWLPDRLDGRWSIGDIADTHPCSVTGLKKILHQLVEKKMITVHIEVEP